MNRRIITGLLVSMVLLTLLAVSTSTAVADTTVSIDNASADKDATTTTPIKITGLTEQLGTATVVLEYNANVEVVGVTSGTMGTVTPGIDNTAHRTTIVWSTATGVTGAQTFAVVELKAVGDPDTISPLDITVTEFLATDLGEITVDDDDGEFTVGGTPSSNAIVSIDDASADKDATTTTPIKITGLTEQLGTATVVLEYNANVEVVGVTSGTMGTVTPGIDNTAHRTTIVWSTATGVTGAQTFAVVELKAVGDPDTISPLDITVTEFLATDLGEITVDDDDGEFTVGGTPSSNAIVSIDDASADKDATTTTPIKITGLTEQLGTATVVLEYNANVEVVGVTSGTMGTVTPGIDNTAHRTTIVWSTATGVTGAQTFAVVELKAVGDPDTISPLDITVTEFLATDLGEITVDDDDGVFTVGDTTPPLTATRDISDQTVEPGSMFRVTLTLTANVDVVAPALDEDLPPGWIVTEVDNGGATYKPVTTEWVWTEEMSSGETKIVTYNVTVPMDAIPQKHYNITGNASAHSVDPVKIGGDSEVVIIDNNSPSVKVIFPNGGELLLTDKVTLNASAIDTDGTIVNVEFSYSMNGGTWTALGDGASGPDDIYEYLWDTTGVGTDWKDKWTSPDSDGGSDITLSEFQEAIHYWLYDVPIVNDDQYLIRAVAIDNNGATGTDQSDGWFMIGHVMNLSDFQAIIAAWLLD